MEKTIQYATLIAGQIQQMFEEDSENYIDPQELMDGDNFKAFIYALSTIVPCKLLNNYTNGSKNYLEFNHLTNQLCFENMTIGKEDKPK